MNAALERLFDDRGLVDMAAISDMTGEPIARLAKMTDVSAGALRKNPTSKGAQQSGRILVSVLAELTRLLGSQKAALIWMRTPHPELENAPPLELFYKREFEAVQGLVHDIASGAPS